MTKRIPNLFIVGAAKSGTTSLWYLLRQHPNIFMQEDRLFKEPGYFSHLRRMNSEDKYLKLFSSAKDEKYIGEASTAYLTDPVSSEKIFEFNPDSKIIIMLRNPTCRAYSLYNWMVQEGYEYSSTFEEALSKEERRKGKKIPNFFEPEYYYNYMYFESGLYHSQIVRYIKYFGQEKVSLNIFEEFIKNPTLFMVRMFDWLNISHHHVYLEDKKNPSFKVIHPYFGFLIRKIIQINTLFKKPRRKDERDFLLNLVRRDIPPPPINPDTYKKLCGLYQDEYKKLESDFSLDLTLWRKTDQIICQR